MFPAESPAEHAQMGKTRTVLVLPPSEKTN